MKKVICITGPTASGKTSLSIKLAKQFQTEIINVDSVQMNKYFDIGSAKVTEKEKEGIKHHLIDFIEIGNDYTIYEYQKDARELIDKIKLPILVGGSGLYLKSALYDYQLSDEKENNHLQINDKLLKEMYEEIVKEDPDYDLHPNNHQRIIRAYQLLKQGVLPSSKNKKDIPLYNILIIYLDIDRKALKQRLIKRLNLMFKEGFIDEV